MSNTPAEKFKVIDLATEQLPTWGHFGCADIAGTHYCLGLAKTSDANCPPLPIAIDRVRNVAWIGSWSFLIEQAQSHLAAALPLH